MPLGDKMSLLKIRGNIKLKKDNFEKIKDNLLISSKMYFKREKYFKIYERKNFIILRYKGYFNEYYYNYDFRIFKENNAIGELCVISVSKVYFVKIYSFTKNMTIETLLMDEYLVKLNITRLRLPQSFKMYGYLIIPRTTTLKMNYHKFCRLLYINPKLRDLIFYKKNKIKITKKSLIIRLYTNNCYNIDQKMSQKLLAFLSGKILIIKPGKNYHYILLEFLGKGEVLGRELKQKNTFFKN